MMPRNRSVHERLHERRQQGKLCAVDDCGLVVQKLGSLCEKHDIANERTGHPLGHIIRMRELRPSRDLVRQYVKANRDHPAVAAALQWLQAFVHTAERRLPARVTTDRQRLDVWLCRLAEQRVEPEAILVTVASVFLLQLRSPHTFTSDRHLRHMVSHRVLRLVRGRRTGARGNGVQGREYKRIGVGVRDLLWNHIEGSVGLLALRIAHIIHDHTERNTYDHLLSSIQQPLPGEQAGRHQQGINQ